MNSNAHERVLVSLDAATPKRARVGLAAEALVYFDRVSLLVSDAASLAPLIEWFIAPGEVETFLILLRDGVFDFVSPACDPAFSTRVLEDESIATMMKGQHRHSRLLSYGGRRTFELGAPGLEGRSDPVNVVLEAAALVSADLMLPLPISVEVQEQLAARISPKSFETTVSFPSVRALVDEGRLGPREVIDLRRLGRPLRRWLQTTPRSSPETFAAVHGQIARESGLQGRRSLSLRGDLAGAGPDEWRPIVLGV